MPRPHTGQIKVCVWIQGTAKRWVDEESKRVGITAAELYRRLLALGLQHYEQQPAIGTKAWEEKVAQTTQALRSESVELPSFGDDSYGIDQDKQTQAQLEARTRPCMRCDCKDFNRYASAAFRCKCGHPIGDHQR